MGRYSNEKPVERFTTLSLRETTLSKLNSIKPSDISNDQLILELCLNDDLMKELIGRISDKRKIATDLFEVIESIRNS